MCLQRLERTADSARAIGGLTGHEIHLCNYCGPVQYGLRKPKEVPKPRCCDGAFSLVYLQT